MTPSVAAPADTNPSNATAASKTYTSAWAFKPHFLDNFNSYSFGQCRRRMDYCIPRTLPLLPAYDLTEQIAHASNVGCYLYSPSDDRGLWAWRCVRTGALAVLVMWIPEHYIEIHFDMLKITFSRLFPVAIQCSGSLQYIACNIGTYPSQTFLIGSVQLPLVALQLQVFQSSLITTHSVRMPQTPAVSRAICLARIDVSRQ